MKQRGFTLIELLVVIGIIALLSAIIFPVFATARAKARQIACVSNMRQLGVAISLYTQDSDDIFPSGSDPSDKYSLPSLWSGGPFLLPLLNPDPHVANEPGILTPYVKNNEVWRCPSDTGFSELDNAQNHFLNAHPTEYNAYGTSYLERTEIAYNPSTQTHLPRMYSTLTSYTVPGYPLDNAPPCTEHGVAEINILMDGSGAWHGGLFNQRRYDVLMADGHVVSQDADHYNTTWHRILDIPSGCPGYVTP